MLVNLFQTQVRKLLNFVYHMNVPIMNIVDVVFMNISSAKWKVDLYYNMKHIDKW